VNTLFYHRRFLSLMAAPLFLFFLARVLIIAMIPLQHDEAPVWKESPKLNRIAPVAVQHPMSHAVVPVRVLPAPQAQIQQVQEEPLPINGLPLQSTLREFHYVLSGQVTCGNAPCAADLHLVLQSDHNDDLKQIFTTGPDGRFECRMTFKENLHQLLDWRVMVYTPQTYPVELHGRQILTDDDDDLNIQKNIQLP
jgi:hypothetical protein